MDSSLEEIVYMANLSLAYNEEVVEGYSEASPEILAEVKKQAQNNLEQVLDTMEYLIKDLGKTLGYEA